MKVNDEEYKLKLQQFFEDEGPPDGVSMTGSWAWHVQKEREFRRKMVEEGELEPDHPAYTEKGP